MKRILLRWAVIVVGLVGLSMDFWRWDDPIRLGPLGVPSWILFFIGLQLMLSVILFLFARKDWGRTTSSEDDQ